jgi:hypothetical protein
LKADYDRDGGRVVDPMRIGRSADSMVSVMVAATMYLVN